MIKNLFWIWFGFLAVVLCRCKQGSKLQIMAHSHASSLPTKRTISPVNSPLKIHITTHIVNSHTNRSVWHVMSVAVTAIGPIIVPINRPRHNLRLCLSTVAVLSAAKSYGIKTYARWQVLVIIGVLVALEGPTALDKRLEWGKAPHYHSL